MMTNEREIPRFVRDASGFPVLLVDGKPYLALAGEVHNSSASSPEYMERVVWPSLEGLALDTLIVPLYWEAIEPEQGEFDFSLVEGIVAGARERGVRLALAWFGLWKNGESYYAPGWVKRDAARFFRARYPGGALSDTVSPLCEAAVAADAAAFARLMGRLAEIDPERTVIFVQVENEVGMLGAERDFSAEAERAYAGRAPELICDILTRPRANQSWPELLGEHAPEWFMGYHYARAVERIAAAGKAAYPLPMYVNAWLAQFPERPGVYPSGGPVSKLIELWQRAAPSVDAIAPDIYLPDFARVCDEYARFGNPLLIPEARRDPVTASNAFYAAGRPETLCFSPFGIDSFKPEWNNLDPALADALNIDLQAASCAGTFPYLARSYEVLSAMKPMLLRHRALGKVHPFIWRSAHERGVILPMDGLDLQIRFVPPHYRAPESAGFVVEEAPGRLFLAGCNFSAIPLPKRASGDHVTIVRIEEGRFERGEWRPGRVLNGDEARVSIGDMADVVRLEVCVHKASEARIAARNELANPAKY